jgi:hypothetical protein
MCLAPGYLLYHYQPIFALFVSPKLLQIWCLRRAGKKPNAKEIPMAAPAASLWYTKSNHGDAGRCAAAASCAPERGAFFEQLFVSASAATAADDERDRGRAPECIFDAACTPPLHFHKFALVSKLKRGIYGRLIFNFSSRWPIPSRLLMTHEIDNLRLRAMMLADTFTCGVCVRAERKLCFCSLPHFSYSWLLFE